MTFRYIGSKARLVTSLSPFIGQPNGRVGRFVDLFCGTGVVAEAAAALGWPVLVNDSLASAVTMATARVIGESQVSFSVFGGYHAAIARLNALAPAEGVMWREYTPAAAAFYGAERRYFTEENGGLLDAMRSEIAEWRVRGELGDLEHTLLIADLLSAANRVANIAGTYGCFLSSWQRQALNRAAIIPRRLNEIPAAVMTSCKDAFDVQVRSTDVVYIDPPYTKRQYASYYHILETLTLNDHPVVEGVCGLRPWKDKSSPFCFKARALDAMKRLVEQLAADVILISYSDEGHIGLADLERTLRSSGAVRIWPLDNIGRYRPNKKASSNGGNVTEYLIRYERSSICLRAANG